ncbi:MAG: hypothetical protein AB1758_26035 [Candidatus Eremiobacterota bacterium]
MNWLHNMCARPNTTVEAVFLPLRKAQVSFCWTDAASAFLAPPEQGLEEFWATLGLRGAVFLYPGKPQVRRATHPALILNVLGRTRCGLLLPHTPLSLEEGFLRRTLTTDDPRLVEIVLNTGTRRP